MDNTHHLIRNFKSIVVLLCICFFSREAVAQSVNITVNITPPYSPFYADYSGVNASKVLLTLQNLTNTTKNIKLTGQLEGDNGIRITTKSNYVPLQPIVLGPNQVRQLNGVALKDIFDVNTLNVYGIDKVKMVQTSRLPEGNYTFCIQAVDMANNQVISSTAPQGCTFISITYPDAPVLINPMPEAIVSPSTPQSVVFNWINAGYVPAGIHYQFQLAEMPGMVNMNPNQLLNASSFPLINKIVNGLSYMLSPADAPLKPNTVYAWRVKAIDPSGKIVFKNEGVSQAGTFKYGVTAPAGKGEILAKAPVITSPAANTAYKQGDNGIQPHISLSWTAVNVDYPVNYEVKVMKVPKAMSTDMAIAANTAVFSRVQSGTNIVIEPLNPYQIQQKTKTYIQLDNEATYAAMVTALPADTAWYYAQQQKLQHEGKTPLQRIENNGRSKPVIFTYAENKSNDINNTPISTSIAGRFFYRYKAVDEKPLNPLLGFPTVGTLKQIVPGTTQIKEVDMYDNEKYPGVAGNNLFAMGSNVRPLKNVTINFVYTIYKSNSKNPAKFTDLTFLNMPTLVNLQYWAGYELSVNGQKVKYNTIAATTKAKADGSFNVTFNADNPIGYLGTEKGVSYFGAIQLLIADHDYYTSPDLLVMPKQGQTTTIPDDIVFVRSYDAEVLVKTTTVVKTQAVDAGKPLSNYNVTMADVHTYISGMDDGANYLHYQIDPEDNPLTIPVEANVDSYAGQLLDNINNQQIIDNVKTDAYGVARFKNLLTAHSHYAAALSNPFEGTLTYKPAYSEVIKAGTGQTSVYNTAFIPETIKQEIIVKPAPPEIYLRAITIQNGVPKGIPLAKMRIYSYDASTQKLIGDEYYNTDENGYLKLSNLPENVLRTLILSKPGFADKQVGITKQLIVPGERFPATVEQEMWGAGMIAGIVVNERGQPVECNIKVADGPYIKTSNGVFTIQNAPAGWLSVQVIPGVDNYFAENLAPVIKADGNWTVVTNPDGAAQGRIVLKEKLHRVQFKVTDESGKVIAGANVKVGNSLRSYLTLSSGLTSEYALASPDNEFKIQVSANGYVNYEDYAIIPLAKTAKLIVITLKKGQTINGIVVDAQTKVPIANARVYTVSGTNADGEVQNETYTDANGKYTLSGVIGDLGYYMGNSVPVIQPNGTVKYISSVEYGNLPVTIYAVKSGNNAYLRQEKSTKGTSTTGISTANFELQPLSANAQIWGMPIEINSLRTVNQSTYITGAFTQMTNNTTFKALPNTKLPFSNLAVSIKQPSGIKIPGKPTPTATIEPIDEKIELNITALKLIAFDHYQCEVLGTNVQQAVQKLSIDKNGGSGMLSGYITTTLASFNFSYNYDGKFLLNALNRIPGKSATLLPVFAASSSFAPATVYALSALYGRNDFRIHNFSAKLSSGRFDKDAFYLDATVNLQIPMVGLSTMPAGQLKVTNSDIVWNQYTGDINIPLEKWTIKGKGLVYDLNKGGFNVVNGILVTDLPQLALNNIMLMPNRIDLGETKLTGKEALSISGVAPLNLMPDARLTLNYDDAAPFDQKPHYRINISGTGNVVAYLNDLPGIGSSKINIRMLSSYSDAVHKTILLEDSKINYYNIISQNVSGIDIGENFFSLMGNTDLGIPGANNNITGRFKFVKEPSNAKKDKNGVVLYVDKLQTDVEMAGKVRFEGYSYTLEENKFTADGKVLIYKNSPSDAISGINGRLTKTVNGGAANIDMNILQNQQISMGSKSLLITQGGNKVQSNTWNNLKFTGQARNFTSGSPGGTKNMFAEGKDLFDFEVKGGIETDKASTKQISISDINTPFGGLSFAFDFEKRLFQGSLAFSNMAIPVGPVVLQAGTVDAQMDANGFILAGTIQKSRIEVPPLPEIIKKDFKCGVAIGYYGAAMPAYIKNNLLGVTLYNELPGSVTSSLKGFYVNIMKSLSKNDLPQLPGPNLKSIPIIGSFVPTFDFSAGIDMYAYLNVANGAEIGIGGKAFAQASCYYDLEACTIGLSAGADGQFDMQFKTPGDLTGQLRFGMDGRVSYCVGSVGVGIDLLLKKDGDGFKFKPSLR